MALPSVNISQLQEIYRNQLRSIGSVLVYQPMTKTEGTYGEDEWTAGASQSIPARVDEVGLESELVKAGILDAGDYVIGMPGDEDFPERGQVVVYGNTCLIHKIGQRNLGVKKEVYLKKVRPDV